MLILASNNDRIQLITGSAGAVDVHASWMDNVSGAVAPGRTNTAITTAATTVVVGGPAVGTFRSIKTLHVFNKGTTTVAVTVVHTDGTNAVELHKVSLSPAAALQYIDDIGFVLNVSGSTAGLSGSTKLIAQKVITSPINRVDFTQAINDAYIEYELHAVGIRVNDGCYAGLRVSKDRGATWDASTEMRYGHLFLYMDMNGVNVLIPGWDDHLWLNNGMVATTVDTFATNSMYLKFTYPQKSGSRKQFLGDAAGDYDAGGVIQRVVLGGEFWDDGNSNPAINAIRFMLMPDGGPANMISGTINLYGTRA